MAASSQQYCLRWNNHRSNLLTVFEELLQNEAFTDVTLAVDGGAIKCHKMVLVACSTYFRSLFIDLPCKHPIVVLKDVKFWEIKAILEYMYRGEVNVAQDQLGDLIKIAEVLNVKGLVKENSDESREFISRREETEMSSPPPAISTSTGNATQSSGHTSPPHSTAGCYPDIYGSDNRIERGSQDHYVASSMWQMSGVPLRQPLSSHRPISSHHPAVFGTNYDKCFESSFKRKKSLHQQQQQPNLFVNRDTPILRTVLGQGHADSSQTGIPVPRTESHEEHFRSGSKGSAIDTNRRNSTDLSLGETAHSPYKDIILNEEEKQQPSPQPYSGDNKSDVINYTPAKPDWKRYKQYTREDITAAIEAVKGGMSAVQAARKYGVPSRTLYDKVKKLGITTSRPFKRASNGSSTACFPYGIGSNTNGSIYSGVLPESDGDNTMKSMTSVTPETVYAKSKDMSHDRSSDSVMSEATRCSPVICCIKKEENINDEVEDLSVSRKSDVPVVVPTTSGAVKEEEVQNIEPDCN